MVFVVIVSREWVTLSSGKLSGRLQKTDKAVETLFDLRCSGGFGLSFLPRAMDLIGTLLQESLTPITLCSRRVVGSNTLRLCCGTRRTSSSPFGRGQLWPLSRAVSGWQRGFSASIHPLSIAFSRPMICKQPKEGTWSSSGTLRGGRVKSGGLSI